jgi:chromatin segregation and condensation protein Rec8/ScpA/Scc1 (kleisin family)
VQLGPEPELALQDVSIFDLIAAFNEALKKAPKEDLAEIFSDRYTVADKIDYLRAQLRDQKALRLSELLAA